MFDVTDRTMPIVPVVKNITNELSVRCQRNVTYRQA